MKALPFLHLGCLVAGLTSAQAATLTVTTTDNSSGPGDGVTSLDEALRSAIDGDTIEFNIPGAGPHVIVTPLGGYPLITAHNLTINGYSQPDSVPNSNPILGGNNAQIKIVLDSTGSDSGTSDPQDPALNSRRSTRILHSGYGDSENGILAIFGGDNFTVRGLSFIARRTAGSTDDPSIYAVALVNQSTNARVQGCWFGLAPGGSTMADVKPVSSAVAAFRYRTGGDVYSAGCIVGTDGDGVKDREEFNVMVGGRISLALELPGARISGNYVNVFPDGLHFVDLDDNFAQWQSVFEAGGSDPGDVTIENFENGRLTDGSVIGTNGDGVSDSDERNVFNHVVYDSHGEFYSNSRNFVCAGNYFGVGIDGVTPAPLSTNIAPNLLDLSGTGQVRIGSNGDGVSDDLEGNLIVNVAGSRCIVAGSTVPIVCRRNKLVNCSVTAVPFGDGENAPYSAYYTPYLADVASGAAPTLSSLNGGILRGRIPAPGAAYPNASIDLYYVDPAALKKTDHWPNAMTHPGTFIGTYQDNSAADQNPAANEFAFDVSSLGLAPTTYLAVAVNYSADASATSATNSVTSPMSNPISARPTIEMRLLGDGTTELSWIAPGGLYFYEVNYSLDNPDGWFGIGPGTYNLGRNVATLPTDFGSPAVFFRLATQ